MYARKTKKWFKKGKFYRAINGDGTTCNGFKNNTEIGGKNEAKDWDPDPNIDYGEGIHVVEGHPLLVLGIIKRNNPIFVEVETYPNPPILSFSADKYRCQYAINKRIITDTSPEFDPKLLAQIAAEDKDCDVRQVAVRKLDADKHAELLAQIAAEDENWSIRQVAVRKLDADKHAKLLAQIAAEDEDCDVRQVAVRKLDADKHAKLLSQIATEDEIWHVRQAAAEKLEAGSR